MNKYVAIFIITLLISSCLKETINPLDKTIKQKFIIEYPNIKDKNATPNIINCYIFKDSVLYKVLHNLDVENENHVTIETPSRAQLFFFTNTEEPASLVSLKEGEKNLSSFLKIHNENTKHSQWGAPLFYSGSINLDPTIDTDNIIELSAAVAQIDIDASSDGLIQIDSIKMSDASSTTPLFEGPKPISSTDKRNYSHIFPLPVSGIIQDVFRPYESNTPLKIKINGTYNKIAFAIDTTIPHLKRNKNYVLKIEDKDIEILPDKNIHIITPDSKGRLNMYSEQTKKYLPGSTIYLVGNFLNVRFTGLKGTAEHPIRITNYPGKKLVIGNPDWAGGALSSALQLLECQHIILGGENNETDFLIDGSISEVRSAYFGINLRPFTDNVEIKNITIRNGGTGILAKTDPEKDDPKTWYPNTVLENLSIHNVTITNVSTEAMYIGHTAVWWGWDEKGKGYNAGAKPENPNHTYVMPVKWKNVKIYQNHISNTGYDGIQASAMDQLEIYENEITGFGTKAIWGQNAGIIVGGRTTETDVHDNYVHDGVGEIFQFHGSGENNSIHTVHNNLFVNSQSSGMGIYGLNDDATINISNNTIAGCQLFAIQVNGRYNETLVKLNNNVFVECYQKDPSLLKYIRIMNNGKVEESENKTFDTLINAKIDPQNYYQPLQGSSIGNAGYKHL